MEKYVCIVIGAGPAALEAALFLGRASVSTLVIGDPTKSDLAYGRAIGNFFSQVDEPPGKTLLDNAVEHAKKYGVLVLSEEVVDLEQLSDKTFQVTTEKNTKFVADSVIIATGLTHVKAGIKSEDQFFGAGVHTCVACDGFLCKGKKIGIVGSGSHALQEAVELATFTNQITVFTQGDEPSWSKELSDLAGQKNIVISNRRITALKGEKKVEGAVFSDKTEEPLDGIFVALGSASGVTFAYKLGLEQKDNFLVIDRDGKTNFEGIWAAGAVTGGNAQIAKSVGEGCNAAVSVIKKAKGLAQYSDQT